jgi:hypothetical protein
LTFAWRSPGRKPSFSPASTAGRASTILLICFFLEIAGQEAELLAGLYGGARKHDSPDLLLLEHRDRDSHSQVRLASPCRADTKGQVVGQHRFDIFLLTLGSGLDNFLVSIDRNCPAALVGRRGVLSPDHRVDFGCSERARPKDVFLHFADDLGGPVYVLFLTFDRHPALAGGDLHVERFAQKTKIAVGPGGR